MNCFKGPTLLTNVGKKFIKWMHESRISRSALVLKAAVSMPGVQSFLYVLALLATTDGKKV